MKKSINPIVSLCVISFLVSGFAIADSAYVSITENGCFLRTENGNGVLGDLHLVTASNDNGNVKLTCSQEFEPTSSGRSVIFNYDNSGGFCGVGDGKVTDDWHEVISANGQAKLTCHYKADK